MRMTKRGEDEMNRACSKHGEKRNVYSGLVRRQKRRRPGGIPRRRLEDNIKMDLREIA
jgi:hypothetical protein